jgi:hypothetical protein
MKCHDSCTTGADCNSGCCVSVTNGGAVCAAATYCAQPQKGIGDACAVNSECISGMCTGGNGSTGWCTEACSAANNVCAGKNGVDNQYGGLNWCVTSNGAGDLCFPGCYSTSDCSPYPGSTCQSATSVADGTVGVCAY